MEKGIELHLDRLEDLSRTEQDFEDLWRTFFRHIEIDARKNPRCQMNMMPKYFWKDMTEMQPNKKDFPPLSQLEAGRKTTDVMRRIP